MAIVRCPRCRDEVTVPAKATSRALVRCPLCLEEYLLAEALANAPPLLVIIGGEVPQAAIDDSPVVGHDYQLAAAVLDSPENHWGRATAATLPPRTPSIRTSRRARSRGPNIALLLLNWVGGGVLGLALAPLVLWWFFKVDPVELGPTVAAYVPWAVPEQFHGKPAASSMDSEPASRPAKPRPKLAIAENESEPARPGSMGGLQTLPNLDTAAPIVPAVAPTIDTPELRLKPANPPPAANDAQLRSEDTPPRPPMPVLTDLLP